MFDLLYAERAVFEASRRNGDAAQQSPPYKRFVTMVNQSMSFAPRVDSVLLHDERHSKLRDSVTTLPTVAERRSKESADQWTPRVDQTATSSASKAPLQMFADLDRLRVEDKAIRRDAQKSFRPCESTALLRQESVAKSQYLFDDLCEDVHSCTKTPTNALLGDWVSTRTVPGDVQERWQAEIALSQANEHQRVVSGDPRAAFPATYVFDGNPRDGVKRLTGVTDHKAALHAAKAALGHFSYDANVRFRSENFSTACAKHVDVSQKPVSLSEVLSGMCHDVAEPSAAAFPLWAVHNQQPTSPPPTQKPAEWLKRCSAAPPEDLHVVVVSETAPILSRHASQQTSGKEGNRSVRLGERYSAVLGNYNTEAARPFSPFMRRSASSSSSARRRVF